MDTRRFSAAVLTGRISAAVVSSTLAVASATAGEVWDGGSPVNSNWSSPLNWQPNGVPLNDGTSDLVFQGNARLSPVMDADWDVHMIEFSASAGAFVIGGTSRLTIRHQIANYDAQLQTISVGSIQTVSGAAQTWHAINGPLRLETDTGLLLLDDLTFAGGFDITLAGGEDAQRRPAQQPVLAARADLHGACIRGAAAAIAPHRGGSSVTSTASSS